MRARSLQSCCCKKVGPFQSPKLGSCLTLRNELSKETYVLTKQEILLGKGTLVESSRVRETRRTALPHGLQSWVLWWWISFLVVFSQSFRLRVLPGDAHLVQLRWMPRRKILGGGWKCGLSFWPFLNSSGWRRLIGSMFLTRTSCCKRTHIDGYYGAGPGQVVSPMLVLEINPIVEFVANYLCVFLGYLGKVLYYKALTGWPWEHLLKKKL